MNVINNKANKSQIYSNSFEEEFAFVENSPNETGGDSRKSCPIRLNVNRENKFLLISLGNFPIPKEPEKQREISFSKLLKVIKSQKISKIKITSAHFSYENSMSFSALLTLLLNIRTNTEIEFFVIDEKEAMVESLNILMFAALKHSKKLLRISLDFSYCNFNHEEFMKTLGVALYRARKLKYLELKMLGKTIPFVRIFNGIMSGQKRFKRTLQTLIINCQNFDDRAAILRMFTVFRNLKNLKLDANQIDIDDELLLSLPPLIQKLETFSLSLKNKCITNYGVEKFLKIEYPFLKEISLDLRGANIDNEAFDGLIFREVKNFKQVEKIEFDIQDTKVNKRCKETIKYFVKVNQGGQEVNKESSVWILKNPKDLKEMSESG